MIDRRSRYWSLAVIVCATFAHSTARADVRTTCARGVLDNVRDSGIGNGCFSNHPCRIGVRGAWVDLTTEVRRVAGAPMDPNPITTFHKKGTEREPSDVGCLADGNSDNEGFVVFDIGNVGSAGNFSTITLDLIRPSLFGLAQDKDRIVIPVVRGQTFLENEVRLTAVEDVPAVLTFRGGNLGQLRIRNAPDVILAGATILPGRTDTAVSVQMTFPNAGTFTADNVIEFADRRAVPFINQQSGFPEIVVSRTPAAAATETTIVITRSGNGTGSVVSGPAGVNCGTTCEAEFDRYTNVAFTATANAGSRFRGWTGGCTTTDGADCNIDNSLGRSARANAEFNQVFLLTVTTVGAGTVTGGAIDCGASCTAEFTNANATIRLTAGASPRGRFTGWGGACAGQDPCTVSMNGGARNVTANFSP